MSIWFDGENWLKKLLSSSYFVVLKSTNQRSSWNETSQSRWPERYVWTPLMVRKGSLKESSTAGAPPMNTVFNSESLNLSKCQTRARIRVKGVREVSGTGYSNSFSRGARNFITFLIDSSWEKPAARFFWNCSCPIWNKIPKARGGGVFSFRYPLTIV